MSTIVGEPVVINGVAESGAGFVMGLSITDDDGVFTNVSLIAGKRFVAGISANVMPVAKVATCEFGNGPAVTAAGQASRVLLPNPALLNADASTPVPQYL
jgi:hypothetical protein